MALNGSIPFVMRGSRSIGSPSSCIRSVVRSCLRVGMECCAIRPPVAVGEIFEVVEDKEVGLRS
jgi:hypothetical protein